MPGKESLFPKDWFEKAAKDLKRVETNEYTFLSPCSGARELAERLREAWDGRVNS